MSENSDMTPCCVCCAEI